LVLHFDDEDGDDDDEDDTPIQIMTYI